MAHGFGEKYSLIEKIQNKVQISIAITNWNRREMLLESFAQVIDSPLVTEVVISDDFSDWDNYHWVWERVQSNPKIRLHRNSENVNMSMNKTIAIGLCVSDWVLIGDSDNKFNTSYLDALEAVGDLDANTIYCPIAAEPNFIFEKYAGKLVDKSNVKEFMQDPMFRVSTNCCNYVVNRRAYQDAYEYNPEVKASDTIAYNWNWLRRGGKFYFVPDMRYFHRVHDSSGFLSDINYNMQMAQKYEKMILEL